MGGIIALFIFAALLVVPMVGWRVWLDQRGRRRRALFLKLAGDWGMACRDSEVSIPSEHPESLAATDVWLWGTRDGFRFDIYERLGRYRPTHTPVETQTIIDITDLGVVLPDFVIKPDDESTRFWHKHVGLRPVVILGDVPFSSCNRVEGLDPDAITAFLKPRVTEALYENRSVCVESTGPTLRFYHYEQLLKQEQIEELLDLGLRFAVAAKEAAEYLGSYAPADGDSDFIGDRDRLDVKDLPRRRF